MLPQLNKLKSAVCSPSWITPSTPPPTVNTPTFSPTPSEKCHLPNIFKWLMLAQMIGAFLALTLDLITSSVQLPAFIHILVPMLFLIAGASSVAVHGNPGPYTALSSSATSSLAAFSAFLFLIAPLVGIKIVQLENNGGGNLIFQESTFAVYIFVCLFESVLCMIVASITYRYSKLTGNLGSPLIIYFSNPTPDGITINPPPTLQNEKPPVVQLESAESNSTSPNAPTSNHSEC